MKIPTDYAVLVMAEQLRAYVQQTVKHIPCKLPAVVLCYFDQDMNLVGYSASVWADQEDPLCVARIDLISPSEQNISYTQEGMIAQGDYVRTYLQQTYDVLIHRSFFVNTKARPPYDLTPAL